jgi:tRNA pseudouridine55 synthase
MEGDKWYLARVSLGVATTTDDREGDLLSAGSPAFTRDDLLAALRDLTGAISQLPPRFAAVKVGGRPAYKVARAGGTVTLPTRTVVVHALSLLRVQEPAVHPSGASIVDLTLLIHCGKGTYIRSLARDMGERLGCGGHLAALRRLAAGGVTIQQCYTLDRLAAAAQAGGPAGIEALLQPLDFAVRHRPALVLDPLHTQQVRNGRALHLGLAAASSEAVATPVIRAYDAAGQLIALLQAIGEQGGCTTLHPSIVFPG